ncbi:MAG: secondary thiamine-phosphate synthase enzyme YjbQ [Candidatus Eisenbacteria bacterium]|uniref:Secondary thiamine-phosphate synthase enzyme YjbQ n=1 Tax=Eiseniibacteriota bacterium TaxID=2212470 RepID=A0A948RYA0_UNCEI|nr:secondary thiamine-phosphate synthase enzyme YjbQ [Candidatus Eisenbacteria bacterium]MBU1947839.1 secondary thiamine-phosphate synthase enzyme YjbQ [Candidatus Eisenbacteria bacterium]MBU2693243.1 secondary thiamine-phosphate synthase enzyme YjbQ [Candidatus Eisenbacteria bacterium]
MMTTIPVETRQHAQLVDITHLVQKAVKESGIQTGVVTVFVPHTTAAVTINENADPDVVHDLLADLERIVPWDQKYYLHGEGNSAAHLKSSLIGSTQDVFVENGRLVLGTWQGIYFCEFDGPRNRKVHVKMMG